MSAETPKKDEGSGGGAVEVLAGAPAPSAVALPLVVEPLAAQSTAVVTEGTAAQRAAAQDTARTAEDAALSVARSAERIVLERPQAHGGRRDVHRKHHGCVWGWLKVPADIREDLKHGVLSAPSVYKCWIRFSSSSKRAQSDITPDGRGVAIKLLEVTGSRITKFDPDQSTQDFLFLNGPAFFAANAASMAVAAELEANDTFPSSFFLSKGNLAGLAALARMTSSQADSLLDLVYYSQTPYKLGPHVVKHRLRPARPVRQRKEGSKSSSYLFETLRDDLEPPIDPPPPAPDEYQEQTGDVVLEIAVQLQPSADHSGHFPVDDATAVWDEQLSPFIPVAQLVIPRQRFDTEERMRFAENMSFNPWNGVAAHTPLGSINLARLYAYRASRSARHELEKTADPDYLGEWKARRIPNPGAKKWSPPLIQVPGVLQQLASGLASLVPSVASWPASLLSGRYSYLAAPVVLALLLLAGRCGTEPWYCAPLVIGAPKVMLSEAMIPPVEYAPEFRGTSFETDAEVQERNPAWTFRYAAVGAEGNGGTPYWIFRALPKLFPEYFGERRDFSEFGLQLPDDTEFYTNYHDLPRGVVLTQPVANLGGNQVAVGLQLVTFNCASCHRGEYTDATGKPHFVDGMPNLGIDTAGYKRAVFRCLRDERFTTANVVAVIDELLLSEHQKRPKFADGTATPSALNAGELIVYEGIVSAARKNAWAKPLAWMDQRPDNGPGRLDAFGALRFEFLGFENEPTHIATVDLPSIWHQEARWRPWHHYDGNTNQPRARNFGAIIGIGGLPETLRKTELLGIGGWIERLGSPKYPFMTPEMSPGSKLFNDGEVAYAKKCASCHGTYDSDGRLTNLTPCMLEATTPDPDPMKSTDLHRFQAIDEEFVRRLNNFGTNAMVWGPDAFHKAKGYICPPLDGIWARAPYLHNGSVPTLRHLLGPAQERPLEFQRGNPAYDRENGGFVWDKPPEDRRRFTFDTRLPGNSNTGHAVEIDEETRKAIISYLLNL